MCETSDERLYYIRTSLMYTDLTRELLFKVFRFLIKRENITDFLSSPEQQTKLWELSKRNLLNKCDYDLVSGQVLNLERFDISLLIRLILNLCKDETPKPQLGWKKKPLPKDESLGADLLRLRNVRNKIIGHRADAKLSEAEYKKVWAKVKAILLRVIEQVDKDSREDFERRLNEYQQLNIDAEKSKVQRLLNELLQYKKEIDFLQEKVEELIKRSQEFKTYFKTTPERFIRYIKLLFDGGRLVLSGILDRELGEQDLLDFLERNKDNLIKNIEEKYLSCLYPQEPISVNHKKWDVLLLALVLLLMFDDVLSQREIRNINLIKTARLNYADLALQSLDMDDFLTQWIDLINCLNQLSVNIAEDDKHQVERLIERNKRKDNKGCNAEEYFKQLKESGVEVKTLTDVYNEITSQLKDTLRELSQKGIKFQQDHVMELKLQTTCENEEIRRKADDLLESGFQASINGSDHPSNLIRLETDTIVTCLTAHPDVTPGEVKQKCILITLKCSTPCGLLHILDYTTSNQFQRSLLNIANELHYMQGIVFHLQGNLTLESVSRVIKIIGQETGAAFKAPREETIIPLKCSSIDGIRSVLSAIKQEKTTNSLNKIAEQISAELKETVSLNIVPDLMELQSFLDETDSDESGSFCKNEDEKEILHGVIGDAMDNEQTNFNPSTASTESNKSKTRSEHSVDKTNETTIHENADKEAENSHIKAVLVDEKLSESILGKEKDNEQTNFNLRIESKESSKSKASSEHTVDKTNEMTIHEHADKEANNSHIKAVLADEKLSENILGTPEIQINWIKVFSQLSRSFPPTRWKLFAYELLSNCQKMVKSVHDTVDEIELEAKVQHTVGWVRNAYFKVFSKWFINLGSAKATFEHIKDAATNAFDAEEDIKLVDSIERSPPKKVKTQMPLVPRLLEIPITFGSNSAPSQQHMSLNDDEVPGNYHNGRGVYVRSSQKHRSQEAHCKTSVVTNSNDNDKKPVKRERVKKRKKGQSKLKPQQHKRSITEQYIIENAKQNLVLDFMPIRQNDYDMFMNFVLDLVSNECHVGKEVVLSIAHEEFCKAREHNTNKNETFFLIKSGKTVLCLRKEVYENLAIYGNIARPKLLTYLKAKGIYYDSTTTERFLFIKFNGKSHMEDKDGKSNIDVKEKWTEQNFQFNDRSSSSFGLWPYIMEFEEHLDSKTTLKKGSFDQSFESEPSKYDKNNTCNEDEFYFSGHDLKSTSEFAENYQKEQHIKAESEQDTLKNKDKENNEDGAYFFNGDIEKDKEINPSGNPELQIDWAKVFLQLSRSLPASRWKLFGVHLLSKCQMKTTESVHDTVDEIELETKNQHTVGWVIHAYIKVFNKWLDNLGRTNATFEHIKEAVSATIEAKEALGVVLSMERTPPMKVTTTMPLVPNKLDLTFGINSAHSQLYMALHDDEVPGNSNYAREVYLKSGRRHMLQVAHCSFCSSYTRNEISNLQETSIQLKNNSVEINSNNNDKNTETRERIKKRQKDATESKSQQHKRSPFEQYLFQNAKQNLLLDCIPISQYDYDMFMNFVVDRFSNECNVSKEIVLSITHEEFNEAQEISTKENDTCFLLKSGKTNLVIGKEVYEDLAIYGNIARPKLLAYLKAKKIDYDSTATERFFFVRFNGKPQMENKDNKNVSNIDAIEKVGEQNFQVNGKNDPSIRECPDMKESQEHVNTKIALQRNSSDHSFDSEQSKYDIGKNNTCIENKFCPGTTSQISENDKKELDNKAESGQNTMKNKEKENKQDVPGYLAWDIEKELEKIKESFLPTGDISYHLPDNKSGGGQETVKNRELENKKEENDFLAWDIEKELETIKESFFPTGDISYHLPDNKSGGRQETVKNRELENKKEENDFLSWDIEKELETIKDSFFPKGDESYVLRDADNVAEVLNKFVK